jgi:hypothetical protein
MDIPGPRYCFVDNPHFHCHDGPSQLMVLWGQAGGAAHLYDGFPDRQATFACQWPRGLPMSSSYCIDDENQPFADLDCEALLQSEIEFWQEVIANCPDTQPADSLERMQQALALAETRLARVSMASLSAVFPSRRTQ